ncbi:hypothetical protein D3C76_1745210 [compost metagenome]
MPSAGGKAHEHHNNCHAKAGAQEHHLAPVAVGQSSPNRLEDEGRQKINGEYPAAPYRDLMITRHAQCLQI